MHTLTETEGAKRKNQKQNRIGRTAQTMNDYHERFDFNWIVRAEKCFQFRDWRAIYIYIIYVYTFCHSYPKYTEHSM